MSDLEGLLRELAEEHAALDDIVAGLAAAKWGVQTPSPGWRVRDQIGHLHFFDKAAVLAATDPEAFAAQVAENAAAPTGDATLAFARSVRPDELLAAWRTDRAAMLAIFSSLDPKARIPWYGPAMGVMSFATARLMETWAHGCDVADAVGAPLVRSERLRHVVHLAIGARRFSYAVRSMELPAREIRVELASPAGAAWSWGPDDADDVVRGDALEFCRVVTRRMPVADTNLIVRGAAAVEWMAIAQTFAGPPGPDPRPRG